MRISVMGGGFYGSYLAVYYARLGHKVTLYEKNSNIMGEASYYNQAKVHAGYHYPRSKATRVASKKNYKRFIKDFPDAICDNFTQYYGISIDSQITAKEYLNIYKSHYKIKVSNQLNKHINSDLVEKVFEVDEVSFDAAKLRQIMWQRLLAAGVTIRLNCQVDDLISSDNNLVIWCTYANLKDENIFYKDTQIIYLETDAFWKDKAFTVMDGPFFSFTPCPIRKCHILTHVSEGVSGELNTKRIIKAASQYIPAIRDFRIVETVIQRKALYKTNDDGRPIYFKQLGDNQIAILGSKIDNVYNCIEELEKTESSRYVICK